MTHCELCGCEHSVTAAQAAVLLGVSVPTVIHRLKSGVLKGTRRRKRWFIDIDSLSLSREWIADVRRSGL